MKVLRLKDGKSLDLVYNGYDCMVTREVYEVLARDLADAPQNVGLTYQTSLSKLAPALEMSLRGIKINEKRRSQHILQIEKDLRILNRNFDFLCTELFDQTFNVASWKQVGVLLYDCLHLPTYRGKRGTGAAILERFQERTMAMPFIKHIQAIRDKTKQLQNLSADLDNGRYTTSLNVAGTSTGRMSSRKSNFDKGGNAQNNDRRHRGMFIPDDGYVAVEIDLEQADSRNIGAICYHIFGDSSYLDYCESDDLHTSVAQMVWPELEWGDDPRAVADLPYTAVDSYRDIAKKGGHATNFIGTDTEVAIRLGVPKHRITAFQNRYLDALPIIPKWHDWTLDQLEEYGQLTTLFGRRRDFHGRADKQTLKKAVAFQASSMTAHQIDHGILQIYRFFKYVQLLNQVHDSVWFQIPEDRVDEIPTITKAMECPLRVRDRNFLVPLEAMYGPSFAKDEMQKVKVPSGARLDSGIYAGNTKPANPRHI